jgi:hypothetical protein
MVRRHILRNLPLAFLALRDTREYSDSYLAVLDTWKAKEQLEVFGVCFSAVTGYGGR